MHRSTFRLSTTGRLALTAALTACLLTESARPAHADTAAEHQRRGAEYLRAEKYALALTELQVAYEQQQRPILLYFIARCYHNMGKRRLAIEYYDRYIVSEPDPEERASAERHLAELGGPDPTPSVSGTSGAFTTSDRPTERSGPRWGMVAAGATIFGLAYGSALIMGALGLAGLSAVSSKGTDLGLAQAGFGTLMVPVAGPLFSGFILRSPEWSVPWMAVNLPAQIVGVVLLGAGAQGHRKPSSPSLAFLPNITPQQATFTVAGRF
jgi:hypothetical protein